MKSFRHWGAAFVIGAICAGMSTPAMALAELIVDDRDASDRNPAIGDTITVDVIIIEENGTSTGPFVVALFYNRATPPSVGDIPDDTKAVADLNDAEITVSFTVTLVIDVDPPATVSVELPVLSVGIPMGTSILTYSGIAALTPVAISPLALAVKTRKWVAPTGGTVFAAKAVKENPPPTNTVSMTVSFPASLVAVSWPQ